MRFPLAAVARVGIATLTSITPALAQAGPDCSAALSTLSIAIATSSLQDLTEFTNQIAADAKAISILDEFEGAVGIGQLVTVVGEIQDLAGSAIAYGIIFDELPAIKPSGGPEAATTYKEFSDLATAQINLYNTIASKQFDVLEPTARQLVVTVLGKLYTAVDGMAISLKYDVIQAYAPQIDNRRARVESAHDQAVTAYGGHLKAKA